MIEEDKDEDWYRPQLDFGVYKRLVDDLHKVGTEVIDFAGQGEPLTHPKIDEMVEYAKQKRLRVFLTTNGTLLNERRLRRWVKAGLDGLIVSTLAGDQATWMEMHPLDNLDLFSRLRDSLVLLKQIKNEEGADTPSVDLHYVICNRNHSNVEAVVRMAVEVGANSVSFNNMVVFDAIRSLSLSVSENRVLIECLQRAAMLAEGLNVAHNIPAVLETLNPSKGTKDYENVYSRIPCYTGWLFARFMIDGTVYPCCGCVWRYELGNVTERRFSQIWNSPEYAEFRDLSKHLAHNPDFFERCNCTNCPEIGRNIAFHKALENHKQRYKRHLVNSLTNPLYLLHLLRRKIAV